MTHTHLCQECNLQFQCDGEDCEPFHFSVCPVCVLVIKPDAPPEPPKDEELPCEGSDDN
jgi:hypothetical protein